MSYALRDCPLFLYDEPIHNPKKIRPHALTFSAANPLTGAPAPLKPELIDVQHHIVFEKLQ